MTESIISICIFVTIIIIVVSSEYFEYRRNTSKYNDKYHKELFNIKTKLNDLNDDIIKLRKEINNKHKRNG